MKLRLLTLALVVSLLGLFAVAPLSAAAAPPATNAVPLPVTGTIPSLPGGTFTGTFDLTRFAVQNGQLVALGTLTGTLTQTIDGITSTVGQVTGAAVALPVDLLQSTGSCQILDLVLGPLDLDLLGLMVHLDQVHLNITAQSGPGNLLGNLLCAVANLLNNGGPVQGLAALLNQLLGTL